MLRLQDDDESFLYNPLNVYNLIRHVAVGWQVVEQTLSQERQRRSGGDQLPKRVRRVLARSKRDHVPGSDDLDGVAVGIVRLHDYYKFNTSSFVDEGVFETEEWKVRRNEYGRVMRTSNKKKRFYFLFRDSFADAYLAT